MVKKIEKEIEKIYTIDYFQKSLFLTLILEVEVTEIQTCRRFWVDAPMVSIWKKLRCIILNLSHVKIMAERLKVLETAVPSVATWGGSESEWVLIDSYVKMPQFTAEANMFSN